MKMANTNGELTRVRISWGDVIKLCVGIGSSLGIVLATAAFFGIRPADYEARAIEMTTIKLRLDGLSRDFRELTAELRELPRCECALHDYERRILDLERDRFGAPRPPRATR